MRRRYQRTQYYYIFVFLIVSIGFYNSFFGKSPSILNSNAIVTTHIISLFLWLALFGLQIYYALNGRIDLHKKVGKVSYILVPIIVLSTLFATIYSYRFYIRIMPKPEAVKMLFLNCTGPFVFLYLYTMAMVNKKNAAKHQRYMITTTIPFIGAPVYRINTFFIGFMLSGSLHYGSLLLSFLAADLSLVALIIYDYISGRSYRAYWIALAIFTAQQLAFALYTYSGPWLYLTSFF